ncbi:MAG TPA: CAP domain-containing protein [Acidimicrobiia bacterium]|jgi:uncharacterized protein YkwD
MGTTTRMKRGAAVALLMGLIAVGTTACFPDTSASEPADPYFAAMYRAINRDRANFGLPPLVNSPKLGNLAGTWAWQMSQDQYLHHQDLSSVLYSQDFSGYYTLGENIIVAPGYYSADQLEAVWMSSPMHRANILSPYFNIVGVGMVWGPDGNIWACVDFGAL